MKTRLTEELVEAIRATPVPQASAFAPEKWTVVENRIKALDRLLDGETLKAVAENRQIDRKTLRRMLAIAVETGPTGTAIGYDACIPNKRFAPPAPLENIVPKKGHAFALQMVLGVVTTARDKLHAFKGALPTRGTRSAAFDRVYNSIVELLKSKGYADHYPLNTTDGGRRAIIEYVSRYRARQQAETAAELPEEPSITRVEHLFSIRPFDRFEYDEHFIDVDAWMAMPLADGTYQLEHVKQMWLLGMVDVGSWSPVAGSLVIGRKYNSEDVCDLYARSLAPWERRQLVVPNMGYHQNAWMPGCMVEDGIVPRALMAAMDNDASHLSHMTRTNVVHERLGVLNIGRAGNPEGRPYIESSFKRTEDALLRHIAGGFRPETPVEARRAVSTLKGEAYPIFAEALEDIVDIYFSAVTISDRSYRDSRSPKLLIDEYVGSGALLLRCPDTANHVRRLMARSFPVTIKGSRDVAPVVYRDYGRYRSPQLTAQRALIGRQFTGTYDNPYDTRQMSLWDEDGKRILTLHVLPPYAAVAHTLRTRQRAHAWNRANGARPHRPSEAEMLTRDIVVGYHEAVRAAAANTPWAASLVMSGEVPATGPAVSMPHEPPLAGLRPRSRAASPGGA